MSVIYLNQGKKLFCTSCLLFPTFRTSVPEQKLVPFQEIDGYIMQASDKGYSAVISLGSKGLSYATNVVLSTAIKVNSLSSVVMKKVASMQAFTQIQNRKVDFGNKQ